MELKEFINISESFRLFIKDSRNYEQLVLQWMNESKFIFPSTYTFIEEQSHNECDYIDVNTNEKYDAKLFFDSSQGYLIGGKGDYLGLINLAYEFVNEFWDHVITNGYENIDGLKLYELIKHYSEEVEEDENLVLFIPYPIENESSISLVSGHSADVFSILYSELEKNNLVKNRVFYAIYPTLDYKITLRNLQTDYREYLSSELLDKYILFNVCEIIEEK